MMKYESHNTIDFIKDEYFIRWVKDPDDQSDKFWKMWMAKHPEKIEELMHARNMIIDFSYQYDPKLTKDDYVEIFEGILKNSRRENLKKQRYNTIISSKPLRAAAVLSIILISVFVIFKLRPKEDQNLITESVFVTKKSPMGQKTITWLDDGTKVHLNAGSKIRYPKNFSDSLRVLYLEGEAYFEVTKDINRPFVVKAGSVQTTVLGTAFNVKAYSDEDKIDVSVVEGKVKVQNEEGLSTVFEKTVIPDQMVSFDISNQQATKLNFDSNEVLAWTKGIIYFKRSNIKEIIRTLERWYGVSFVVNKELNLDKDFTFTYKNKPLKEILEGLSFAFKFKFEINDKIVIIN